MRLMVFYRGIFDARVTRQFLYPDMPVFGVALTFVPPLQPAHPAALATRSVIRISSPSLSSAEISHTPRSRVADSVDVAGNPPMIARNQLLKFKRTFLLIGAQTEPSKRGVFVLAKCANISSAAFAAIGSLYECPDPSSARVGKPETTLRETHHQA